jgi:hypothetical protein
VIEAGEHPTLARWIREGEETDADTGFAFGLICVLDGLESQLEPL